MVVTVKSSGSVVSGGARRLRSSVGLMAVIAAMAAFTACGLDRQITQALDPAKDPINPVAVINAPSKAAVRSYITIDGSQSYSHRNGALTYKWTLTEKPRCSSAGFGLGSSTPVTPMTGAPPPSQPSLTSCVENTTLTFPADNTFGTMSGVTLFADKGGYYTVTLIVTETFNVTTGGTGTTGATTTPQTSTSKLASMRINVVGYGDNHPPVAVIKAASTAKDVVALRADESYDIDGQPLSYSWKLMTPVSAGEAELRNANFVTAYLYNWMPPPQTFLVLLHVSDGVDYDEAVLQVTIGAP